MRRHTQRRWFILACAVVLFWVTTGAHAAASLAAQPRFPTPTDVAGIEGIDAALSLYNLHRAAVGSPAIRLDEDASRDARLHAQYIVKNGLGGHFEDSSLPDYTTGGDTAARQSALASGQKSAAECVQTLLTVPYHRLNFLRPAVQRVRLAFESDGKKSGCVFGIVPFDGSMTSETPIITGHPVIYPASGQTNVPVRIRLNESPNPLSLCPTQNGDRYEPLTGFPITIEFRSTARGLKIDESSLRAANGQTVEHCMLNAEIPHPDHQKVLAPGTVPRGWAGTMIAIPRTPLAPDTRYSFHVAGTYSGQPFMIDTDYTTAPAFTGTLPSRGGFGAIVTTSDIEMTTLIETISRTGCSVRAVWILLAGRFYGYVPGAPAVVNARFPMRLDGQPSVTGNTPVLIDCR